MSCLMFCITMVPVVISILIKYTVTSLHPVTFMNVIFTESIQYTKKNTHLVNNIVSLSYLC